MFDHILNWKLLDGSHEFPGPDGGTCINEAAIVVAGFEYRAVKSADDCPPCFSRVVAQYAICLNDSMPFHLRQELLIPFATRLSGTADTPQKELERAQYIVLQTVRRILPIALRAVGLEEYAVQCELATSSGVTADAAARAAAYAAYAADAAARAAAYAAYAADAAYAARAAYAYAANAASAATYAARAAAYAYGAFDAGAYIEATKILDEAIKLGNQAEPIETSLVIQRMEAIKQKAIA